MPKPDADRIAEAWCRFVDYVSSWVEHHPHADEAEPDSGPYLPRPRSPSRHRLEVRPPLLEFERLIWEMAQDDRVRRIASSSGVDRALRQLVPAIVKDCRDGHRKSAAQYERDFRRQLDRMRQQWTVFAPVFGVELEQGQEVGLGASKLISATSPTGEHLTRVIGALAEQALREERTTEAGVQHLRAILTAPLSCEKGRSGICGVTNVHACDSHRAEELGASRVQEFVLALRAFRFGVRREFVQPAMGLGIRSQVWDMQVVALAEGGDASEHRTARDRPGLDFRLDATTLDTMRALGWGRLDAIWVADKPSKWESELREAVGWFGGALEERDRARAVVDVAAALEMLLCTDRDEAIGGTVAERVVFIVAPPEDARGQWYRAAKAFYALRSQIVHMGRTDIPDSRFAEAITIAWHVISSLLLLDEIRDRDGLREYCTARKLSGCWE